MLLLLPLLVLSLLLFLLLLFSLAINVCQCCYCCYCLLLHLSSLPLFQVQDGVATAAVTVGVGAVVLGAAMAIGSWLDGGGRQRERHEEKEPQRY